MANARSILSLLLLSASLNSQIEVRASGDDEDAAIKAAEVFFQNDDEDMIQVQTLTNSESRPGDGISSSDPS